MSNSLILKDWHEKAIQLSKLGYSSRKIADLLGKGKSTINDLLVKVALNSDQKGIDSNQIETKNDNTQATLLGPRIFVYDIETSPIIAHMWSMWQQGFGLNQIQSDWTMLSWCGKWLGEDEIFYYDQRDAENVEDDTYILSKLWDKLNEADITVGQNIKRFDTKKVNARFVLNGFPKPSPYRQIDTMVIAKEQFGFTSNKLEYMAGNLCKEHTKDKHKEFPGHEMWVECLKGNRLAWEAMERYNRDDVLATEALYNVLSSWDSKLPNFDIYVDDVMDMSVWEHDGFVYTNMAKYKRYRNKETGQYRRSRVNELSKEKRQQILVNC